MDGSRADDGVWLDGIRVSADDFGLVTPIAAVDIEG